MKELRASETGLGREQGEGEAIILGYYSSFHFIIHYSL